MRILITLVIISGRLSMNISSTPISTPAFTVSNSQTTQKTKTAQLHDDMWPPENFFLSLLQKKLTADIQLVPPPEKKLAALRRIISSTVGKVFKTTRSNQQESISCNTTNVNNLEQSNTLNATDSQTIDNQASPHSKEDSQHSITNEKAHSPEHSTPTLSLDSDSHELELDSEQYQPQGGALQNAKPDETMATKSDVKPNIQKTISSDDSSTHESLNIPSITNENPDTVNQAHAPVQKKDNVNRKPLLYRVYRALSALIECVKTLLYRLSSALKSCFECATPPSFDSKNKENEENEEAPSKKSTSNSMAHNNINDDINDDSILHDTKDSDEKLSPESENTRNNPAPTNQEAGVNEFTSQTNLDDKYNITEHEKDPALHAATTALCDFFRVIYEIQAEIRILTNGTIIEKLPLFKKFTKKIPPFIAALNTHSEQLKNETDSIFKLAPKDVEDRNNIIFNIFTSAIAKLDVPEKTLLVFLENISKFMLRKNQEKSSSLTASVGLKDAMYKIPSPLQATACAAMRGDVPDFKIQLDCTYEPMMQALLNALLVKVMKEELPMENETTANTKIKDKKKEKEEKERIKIRKSLITKSRAVQKLIEDKLDIKQCD